jgi:hypothetical protein
MSRTPKHSSHLLESMLLDLKLGQWLNVPAWWIPVPYVPVLVSRMRKKYPTLSSMTCTQYPDHLGQWYSCIKR